MAYDYLGYRPSPSSYSSMSINRSREGENENKKKGKSGDILSGLISGGSSASGSGAMSGGNAALGMDVAKDTMRIGQNTGKALLGDPNKYNLYDLAKEENLGYGGGTMYGAKVGMLAGGPIGAAIGGAAGLGGDIGSHFWLKNARAEEKKRKEAEVMARIYGKQVQALGGNQMDFGEQSALSSIYGRK